MRIRGRLRQQCRYPGDVRTTIDLSDPGGRVRLPLVHTDGTATHEDFSAERIAQILLDLDVAQVIESLPREVKARSLG